MASSPPPTPHDCTTLTEKSLNTLVHLTNSEMWGTMTEEQHNSILHILKVSAGTSYKMSEAVVLEALSRNASVKPGAGVESRVDGRNSGEAEALGEGRSAEDEKMRTGGKPVAAECERMRVEMADMAARTEKIMAQVATLASEANTIMEQKATPKAETQVPTGNGRYEAEGQYGGYGTLPGYPPNRWFNAQGVTTAKDNQNKPDNKTDRKEQF